MTAKTFEELSKENQELVRSAIKVRSHAYVPQSGYQVGSALRVRGNDTIFVGCNVENAIYLASHAEQVAITNAVAALGGEPKPYIESIAIALFTEGGLHAFPCGFCRQMINEFGSEETIVIGVLINQQGDIQSLEQTTLGELLPYSFGSHYFIQE